MNKKYPLLFFFLLFFFSFASLQAQEAYSFSNIYLKNGGFIKAQILTQDSAGWNTFRLRTGEVIRLESSSISKINLANKKELVHQKGHTTLTEGFYLSYQFGFLVGLSSRNNDPISSFELLSFSAGHQFNPRLQVGGGIALDFYEHSFLPLFAEAKYFLRPKEKVSFYGGLQLGYALSFSAPGNEVDTYGGGAMIHPSIGLRFAGKGKSSFLLELGNRYQWGTSETRWRNTIEQIIYRRLGMRLGWQF